MDANGLDEVQFVLRVLDNTLAEVYPARACVFQILVYVSVSVSVCLF